MPNKQGGQTKYSAARHKIIVQAIRDGATRQGAAQKARVHHQAVANWLRQGEDEQSEYHQFYLDYNEAEAAWEEEMLSTIDDVAKSGRPNTWQAAAWRLERRWPDRYGRFDRDKEPGTQINVFTPSPDQLPNVLRALDQLAGAKADIELEEGVDFHED